MRPRLEEQGRLLTQGFRVGGPGLPRDVREAAGQLGIFTAASASAALAPGMGELVPRVRRRASGPR